MVDCPPGLADLSNMPSNHPLPKSSKFSGFFRCKKAPFTDMPNPSRNLEAAKPRVCPKKVVLSGERKG